MERKIYNNYENIYKRFKIYSLVLNYKKDLDISFLKKVKKYFRKSDLTLDFWNTVDINNLDKELELEFIEDYLILVNEYYHIPRNKEKEFDLEIRRIAKIAYNRIINFEQKYLK